MVVEKKATAAKKKSRREPPVNRLTERGSLRAQRTGGGPLMPRADQAMSTASDPEAESSSLNVGNSSEPARERSTPGAPGTPTPESLGAQESTGSEPDADTVAGTPADEPNDSEQQGVEAPAEPRPAPAGSASRSRGRGRWPIPQPPDFSSRGKLELSGERIVKMTLELPVELVDRLSQWELAYATRTGRRVYRERVLDAALASLPERIGDVVTMARSLPPEYLEGTVETVGTRVRASTEARLRLLRPEMRAQRVRDVYQRHVYTAAILRYLDFLDSGAEEASKKERN